MAPTLTADIFQTPMKLFLSILFAVLGIMRLVDYAKVGDISYALVGVGFLLASFATYWESRSSTRSSANARTRMDIFAKYASYAGIGLVVIGIAMRFAP
jgi:hypothetical protein